MQFFLWVTFITVWTITDMVTLTLAIKVKVKTKGSLNRVPDDYQNPVGSRIYDTYPTHQAVPTKPLTDEQRLLRELMTDYDPHTRPVLNASHPVKVKLGITLNQIFDLDERNQVLTTHIWLDQEWYDDKLKWDPEEFNSLKTIRVPCHLVWKPDIVLYNSADDYVNGYMPALAMVSHDGHVFWPPIVRLRSTCKIDITYFPFDDQMCSLKVGSWAYDGLQVDVLKRDKPMDLSNYVSNGEWELINVKVIRNVQYYSCCPEPYPDVNFTLHIRRRTLYYTYNVIIPCIMLSSLTILGFWIPPEGGEKVGLGLTILLAYSVFMLLIAENMPATSFYIPLIGVYIIVAMGLTCVTVVFSVLVSYIHHQGTMGRPVPSYLRSACQCLKHCLGVFSKTKDKLISVAKRRSTADTAPGIRTPLSNSFINSNSKSQECRSCHHCLEFENIHAISAGSSIFHARLRTDNSHQGSPPVIRRTGSNTGSLPGNNTGLVGNGIGQMGNSASSVGVRESNTNDQPFSSSSLPASRRKSELRLANHEELSRKLDLVLKKQEEILKARDDSVNREWHELAEIIDRALFWLYSLVVFSITVIILLLVPLRKAVEL